MGYRLAYKRGFGRRVIRMTTAVSPWIASSIPSAHAAGDRADDVVVTCPQLPEARAAELEARARATLLTNELSATVSVSCVSEGVIVRVEAAGESVTLQLRVGPATLREEVLRAIDRALADLRARLAPDGQPAPPLSPASEAEQPTAPRLESDNREAPPTVSVAPVAPPSDAGEPMRERQTQVAAHLLGESWGAMAALGGGFGTAFRLVDSAWWCGIRVGALHPPALDQATVMEGHALVELAFTAHSLAGMRFGIGAGPSLLVVSPNTGFFAPGATLANAVRLEGQLSRSFRLGWAELTPWVGVRAFTAERGVRVAQRTRVILGGVLPQIGLALSLSE